MCQKMAENGSHIVIVDKNETGTQARLADLQKKHSIQTLFLDLDLQNKTSFLKIAQKVEKVFGRLDFLVNNAAFYDDMPGWGVPFEEEGYAA